MSTKEQKLARKKALDEERRVMTVRPSRGALG